MTPTPVLFQPVSKLPAQTGAVRPRSDSVAVSVVRFKASALQGYYAAYVGSLPTFHDGLSVPYSRVKYVIFYRVTSDTQLSQLHVQSTVACGFSFRKQKPCKFLDCWTVNMKALRSFETSVTVYQYK